MTRSALALGAVLALPALGGDEVDLEKAWSESRKAASALLEDAVGRAEKLFLQALDEVRDFPAARLGLGHIAMARQDFRAALDEYSAARRGFEHLGSTLDPIEQERFLEAQETIARLRAENVLARARTEPERRGEEDGEVVAELDWRIWRERILANEARIRQLEAIRPPAGGGVPGEVDYHIGNAFFRLKRVSDAVESWESCATKTPDFALVHNNLAVAYLNLDRPEDARRSVEEAERLGMKVDERLKERLRGS